MKRWWRSCFDVLALQQVIAAVGDAPTAKHVMG
jgi:hypothetical protein